MSTRADKLDQIVEALEDMDTYIEYGEPEEAHYNQAMDGFWEALRLARELRDQEKGPAS